MGYLEMNSMVYFRTPNLEQQSLRSLKPILGSETYRYHLYQIVIKSRCTMVFAHWWWDCPWGSWPPLESTRLPGPLETAIMNSPSFRCSSLLLAFSVWCLSPCFMPYPDWRKTIRLRLFVWKTCDFSTGKQCKCIYTLQKPAISASAEMAGFVLVGKFPKPLEHKFFVSYAPFGRLGVSCYNPLWNAYVMLISDWLCMLL